MPEDRHYVGDSVLETAHGASVNSDASVPAESAAPGGKGSLIFCRTGKEMAWSHYTDSA